MQIVKIFQQFLQAAFTKRLFVFNTDLSDRNVGYHLKESNLKKNYLVFVMNIFLFSYDFTLGFYGMIFVK